MFPAAVFEDAMTVDDREGAMVELESTLEWLCGCKSWPACRALLMLAAYPSLAVPDREEPNLSARNPSLFEDAWPSNLSTGVILLLGWASCWRVSRNRVVIGACRGVASLDVRRRGPSVPLSSGDDDRLVLVSL